MEKTTWQPWQPPGPENLPTMYDLPSEDPEEPGLPDEFHLLQPRLLSDTFRPPGYDADWIFTASDINLYYDVRHTGWYKRPDWFGVVGVPRQLRPGELRLSYVLWQEGSAPHIVVELLSPGTLEEDQGESPRGGQPPSKWEVYEQHLRVPYYVLYGRDESQMRAFRLEGDTYRPLEAPRLWIPNLQIGLALWQGEYQGSTRSWLRWHDADNRWIATPVEQERQEVERERQRAEQERQRAEAERLRAERLAERLRQLGVDPDSL